MLESSVTSASMADALVAAYGCSRPVILHNTCPLPLLTRSAQPPSTASPVLVWFSQTIGPGRGLEPFFSAWGRTKNPSRVVLIGDERPGYVTGLLAGLTAERRAAVQVRPLVTPDELTALLPSYDIGLALEPAAPRNKDVTISNKLFQYLAAGLAVVASNTTGQREILSAAPGCGVLVSLGDREAFSTQLDQLLGDPSRLRACQQASRAVAETDYCWERDATRLLKAVGRILPEPSRTS